MEYTELCEKWWTQASGEASANHGEQISSQGRLWKGWPLFHLITCDCAIDILHLTCRFNGSLPAAAATDDDINKVFDGIMVKRQNVKSKSGTSCFQSFSKWDLHISWENIQINTHQVFFIYKTDISQCLYLEISTIMAEKTLTITLKNSKDLGDTGA